MVGERAHLSIGEVLSLLQDEFPDVTISKIRFLESQGLLDPERTPSGYRKFYETDVRRLRWILTEQRDSFLPLKVIKERLDEGSDTELPAPDSAGNGAAAAVPPAAPPDDGGNEGRPDDPARVEPAPPALSHALPAASSARTGAPDPSPEGDAASLPIWMADAARAKADRGRGGRGISFGDGPDPLAGDPTTVSLTVDEILAASGLTAGQLASLEDYGLLRGHDAGADRYYDGEDLVIAQKSAGFLAHGIEARHLRMFKSAAEREADLLTQLVRPRAHQRDAEARHLAQTTVAELAGLGQGLRAALLRAALGNQLD